MATGPGSLAQTSSNPLPLLWDAGDADIIQIFNPLTEDFIGLIGQSKPTNQPFNVSKTIGAEAATKDEDSVQRTYGFSLKNPDHFSPAQITTQVKLPAGAVTSLQGGAAKVVIGQLVNEIMSRSKQQRQMADPTARNEIERDIIKGHKTVADLMPGTYQTQQEVISGVLTDLNEGATGEQEFPTEGREKVTSASRRTSAPEASPAAVTGSRPAKSK